MILRIAGRPGTAGLVALAMAGLSGKALAQAAIGSQPSVAFTKHIAPILYDRCGMCHRPNGPAPFSLLTYAEVRPRASQIRRVTKSRFMPPWKSEPGYGEFVGQNPLTADEIDLIQRWVDAGAPAGNPEDQPRVPQWPDGWQLGTPDLVVRPAEAFTLPAGGADRFRLFVIPIPIDAPRYIAGVEFRPDNPRVVHHANILLDPTPSSRDRNAEDATLGEEGLVAGSARYPPGHFLGWTPGQPDPLLPNGLAWRLDPWTDLVVQLHLMPSGMPEAVQFSVGFYFSAAPPKRTPAVLRLGRQNIDIAAGNNAYMTDDSYVLAADVEVLAIKPHAHFRARAVKGWATLPDGTTKWLINIMDWDFRWQHVYRFVAPVAIPKGSVLRMQYTYDNSANKRNPQQPPQRVLWGPRSSNEMGDLWIQVLPRDDRDLAVLNRGFQQKMASEDAVGYEALVRREPSDLALRTDLARLYLELGRPHEAVTHYEALLRLQPEAPSAHFNLGAALVMAGRREEGVAEYQQALRLKPDYAAAHDNLGNALFEQNRLDAALAHYREVLRLEPNHVGARNNIGLIVMTEGHMDEAIRLFRDALRLDPGSPDAHYNLALALQQQGELSQAEDHFRSAIQSRADWAPALADFAWLLATASEDPVRNADEAIRLAERSAQLTQHRDPQKLDVLAAALAAAGRFDEALATLQEAATLNPSATLSASIRERRELYLRHQTYREPRGRLEAPKRQ